EAAHEDLLDEPLRGTVRELTRERQDDEGVDTRLLDQRDLPLERGKQARNAVRRQDLPRMAVEGHRDRAERAGARAVDGPLEHLAMTEVDTVEEPDRHDGGGLGRRRAG